jgi:hypothetical protein
MNMAWRLVLALCCHQGLLPQHDLEAMHLRVVCVRMYKFKKVRKMLNHNHVGMYMRMYVCMYVCMYITQLLTSLC